jgi:hypothetical protein
MEVHKDCVDSDSLDNTPACPRYTPRSKPHRPTEHHGHCLQRHGLAPPTTRWAAAGDPQSNIKLITCAAACGPQIRPSCCLRASDQTITCAACSRQTMTCAAACDPACDLEETCVLLPVGPRPSLVLLLATLKTPLEPIRHHLCCCLRAFLLAISTGSTDRSVI